MNPTTLTLLNAVLERQRQNGAAAQPPALPDQAEALRERAAFTFGYELPAAYLDLLAVSNGLDHNGIQLYASTPEFGPGRYFLPGLIETNMQMRLGYDNSRYYVFFAESGMDAYRHNLREGTFEIADRVAETSVFESFATADELFQQMLNYMLNIYAADETEEMV